MKAQPDTIPTSSFAPAEGIHAPLTFAERTSELYLMIGEGHVPTISEYLEMQDIVSNLKEVKPGAKLVYDYEQSEYIPIKDPDRTEYVGPDGERISSDVALGLWGASRPGRWFQTPENEHMLSEAAYLMRNPDGPVEITSRMSSRQMRSYRQKMDERFATMLPAVRRLVEPFAPQRKATADEQKKIGNVRPGQEVMVADIDSVGPETLERLVALSRLSRKELEAQGIDIASLIRQKTRVTA